MQRENLCSAQNVHRAPVRRRYAPREEIIPDELTLVAGLTMREAQRVLDCTSGALQKALRTDGWLKAGRIVVAT